MSRFIFFFMCLFALPVFAAPYGLDYVGDEVVYEARYEDTFVHLARDYNLGYVEMRAANPLVDPWLPGEGAKMVLPLRHILPDAPREGIVINLPEMRLYAFLEEGAPPVTFPLGVGREGLETPEGATSIVRKTAGPQWRPTERMRKADPELPAVVEPGPENPLGTHALYLGWPQYAIHGTNRPFGIGRRVSSGCIRMYPEDIKEFYEMVPVGTKVTVVDQPLKLGWIGDELYMDAHPTLEQAMNMEEFGAVYSDKLSDADLRRVFKAAGPYKKRLRWSVIRQAVKEKTGIPVVIARRPVDADDQGVEEEEPFDPDLQDAQSGESFEAEDTDADQVASAKEPAARIPVND